MVEQFLNIMTDVLNVAKTENDAVARKSTKSFVLDFFSHGGAIRNRTSQAQISMFALAWNEEPELALRAMFYFRDVRGGQGQRDAFRNQLSWLAEIHPHIVYKNLPFIAELGRWDDFYSLVDTPVEAEMFKYLKLQFEQDLYSDHPSLLGKWLKSANTSSKQSVFLGVLTRKYFGLTARQYQKALTFLRKKIRIVEAQISAGKWDEVDYCKIPSNAMMQYRNAFMKHDEERFNQFIADAKDGKTKINSSTLYPHEIVGKLLTADIEPDLAQAQWDNLPNYIGDEENSIAVVDVSASMSGTPMEVAIALGIYLAERAKGPYANKFITFSANPVLQTVQGHTLAANVQALRNSDWGYNTNIEKVMDVVLNTAIAGELTQDQMIDKLYIISDMEFDTAMSKQSWQEQSVIPATLFQTIRKKFTDAGYVMPNIVFWNVDSRNDQVPMSLDDRGFQNVSGFSPSIFEALMGGEFITAYDLMLKVLNGERYENITI